MLVRNINGTSPYTCNCGSWLAHWKKFSGQTISSFCSEKSCTNTDLVGAHVQKTGNDDSWYIVPLCNKHNQKTSTLEISDSVKLVSANRAVTCGY